MMNTREEFEKWLNEFDESGLISDVVINEWLQSAWQACQALNDKRIASQKEYYEMVMQDGGKRIAKLEGKLKVAREALGKIHNGVNSHFDAQMVAVEALKTIEG